MRTDKNINIRVLIIGFTFILAVGALTVFKSQKDPPVVSNEENVLAEKEKKEALRRKITSEELLEKIQNRERISIIDLRLESDFQKEHIADSVNIPYSEIGSEIINFEKNNQYVFLDEGMQFQSAIQSASFLSKEGFENVFYLVGGFADWKNKYNPTISAGNPDSFVDIAKVKYISTDNLKKMVDGGENNFSIIDIREEALFNSGHLKGAVNIPFMMLEERRKEIGAGKKIILYADEGIGAFQAAVRLFDMGYFSALALSEGLNDWKQKGYEVVK